MELRKRKLGIWLIIGIIFHFLFQMPIYELPSGGGLLRFIHANITMPFWVIIIFLGVTKIPRPDALSKLLLSILLSAILALALASITGQILGATRFGALGHLIGIIFGGMTGAALGFIFANPD